MSNNSESKYIVGFEAHNFETIVTLYVNSFEPQGNINLVTDKNKAMQLDAQQTLHNFNFFRTYDDEDWILDSMFIEEIKTTKIMSISV